MVYFPGAMGRVTKSAIIIQTKDDDGKEHTMIYDVLLQQIEIRRNLDYNVFDLFSDRRIPSWRETHEISIDAILNQGRIYENGYPDQEEIETPKAITDGNDEIIVDKEEQESWLED